MSVSAERSPAGQGKEVLWRGCIRVYLCRDDNTGGGGVGTYSWQWRSIDDTKYYQVRPHFIHLYVVPYLIVSSGDCKQ